MKRRNYLRVKQILVGGALAVLLTACGGKEAAEENVQETMQTDAQETTAEAQGTTTDEAVITMDALLNHAETPAEDFNYMVNDNSVIIEGYTGNDPIVVIPETIEGKPVSLIRKLGSTGIDAIKLSDSVETIDDSCFMPTSSEGTSVKIVVFGNGVKKIGKNAFLNCSNLEELELNDGLEQIGDMALTYTGVKEIVIPESVSNIGDAAFNLDKSQTVFVKAGSYAESWCIEWKELFDDFNYVVE